MDLKRRRDIVSRGAGLHGLDERRTLVSVDGDGSLTNNIIRGVRLLGCLAVHGLGGEQCHVCTEQEPLNSAHRKARLVRISRIKHISLINMLVRKITKLLRCQA